MVFALATSKKARKVTETEVGLSRKNEGDEMFGSSKVARSLVRWGNSIGNAVVSVTPPSVARYIDRRFQVPAEAADNQAAYDMCRASVNLVVSSLLIALGTSLKLPLSTTFVTFMVAMGSSLADRAWGRETAVFRITGVLTVIGGWFITAGVAFTACFLVAMAMNFGGVVAVVIIVVAGIYSIIHSQQRFARKQKEVTEGDVLFQQMISTTDHAAIVPMLSRHIGMSTADMLHKYAEALTTSTDGLFAEQLRPMRTTLRSLAKIKRELKSLRRRETICLRRVEPPVSAVRLSTNFHLIHNSLRQMLYGIIRIAEPAHEHVDNNFSPVDAIMAERFCKLRNEVTNLMLVVADNLRNQRGCDNDALVPQCQELEAEACAYNEYVGVAMQTKGCNLNSLTLMLHFGQEMQQIMVELRQMIESGKAYREMTNIKA